MPGGRGCADQWQLAVYQSGRVAGLGRLRPNAADQPDQRGAGGRSGVWRTVFAELWLRKRATVYWSRLEQPEAGAERARSVSEASVERAWSESVT